MTTKLNDLMKVKTYPAVYAEASNAHGTEAYVITPRGDEPVPWMVERLGAEADEALGMYRTREDAIASLPDHLRTHQAWL